MSDDDEDCPLCGGREEVEVTYQDQHRDVTACPICLAVAKDAEIARLSLQAEIARLTRELATVKERGPCDYDMMLLRIEHLTAERDALRADRISIADIALAGFTGESDESEALCEINNRCRGVEQSTPACDHVWRDVNNSVSECTKCHAVSGW